MSSHELDIERVLPTILCMFEFPFFQLPTFFQLSTNLGQPMHSPPALTELPLPNIFSQPCTQGQRKEVTVPNKPEDRFQPKLFTAPCSKRVCKPTKSGVTHREVCFGMPSSSSLPLPILFFRDDRSFGSNDHKGAFTLCYRFTPSTVITSG